MTEKVAVVTGAARGLGKSFSEALLARGYKVYFCDINQAEGEYTQKLFTSKYGNEMVQFQKCDVRKEEDFKAFFDKVLQKYGAVDLLVNNAGIIHETEWRRCVDINLNGVIQGTLLAINHMKKSNGGTGGTIINVSSLAGVIPVMYSPVYSATKSAVIAFTRSWAMNPIASGIRLVCLCPAFADTDIIKNTTEEQFQGKEFALAVMDKIGVMTPERVTDAFLKLLDDTENNGKVLYLTSTAMDYVTFSNPLNPTQ